MLLSISGCDIGNCQHLCHIQLEEETLPHGELSRAERQKEPGSVVELLNEPMQKPLSADSLCEVVYLPLV